MKKKYRHHLVLGAITASLFCGMLAGISCSRKPQNDNTKGIHIFVSIPPQKDFIRRIGGDKVNVEILIKPGVDPHTFEPTVKQIVRLGRAKVYFQIDMPFENHLLEKIHSMFPQMKIVNTARGIKRRTMGGAIDHHHEGTDPHIWLDPMLVKIQGANICEALKKVDPSNADYYETNLRTFEADLDKLNADIAAKLAPVKGRTFFVFHPAFGYFADAYGLHQQGVEVDGKSPTIKQLEKLIRDAGEHDAKVIFAEPQFSISMAKTVAKQIGARVETLDPLSEDYFANMRRIAEKIYTALK